MHCSVKGYSVAPVDLRLYGSVAAQLSATVGNCWQLCVPVSSLGVRSGGHTLPR